MKKSLLLLIVFLLTSTSFSCFAQVEVKITQEQLAGFLKQKATTFGLPEDGSIANITDLRTDTQKRFSIYSLNKEIYAAHSTSAVLKHAKITKIRGQASIVVQDAELGSKYGYQGKASSEKDPMKIMFDKQIDKKYRNYQMIVQIDTSY